jgi:hypothetical protein
LKGKIAMSKVKKQEVKKAGRPLVYDHVTIIKILKKHQGKSGGLKISLEELKKLKGFENISYGSLCVIAKKNNFKFGLGKPKPKPVVNTKKKKSSSKKKETVVDVEMGDMKEAA